MLETSRLYTALEGQQDVLLTMAAQFQAVREEYEAILGSFSTLTQAEIEAQIAHLPWPGAWPSVEWDTNTNLVIPFATQWDNHQEARAWALSILTGVATMAADGSQIHLSRDVSLPLGLVQVGWFENRHERGNGRYIKDLRLELITAADVLADNGQQLSFASEYVDWRRFEMEIDQLITYMRSRAGQDPTPLCFFDGSFILSFTQQLHPQRQRRYTQAMQTLLQTSAETRIPIIGYVDTSYAKDLSVLLNHLYGIGEDQPISDAAILQSQMRWGDRTPAWICGRKDQVIEKYYDQVAFTYLKTAASHPPARIEFPRWVVDAGQVETIINLVRAECVVGTGYPYVLETADALAVLTNDDREQFYGVVNRFAQQLGLSMRYSTKLRSKRIRRTS